MEKGSRGSELRSLRWFDARRMNPDVDAGELAYHALPQSLGHAMLACLSEVGNMSDGGHKGEVQMKSSSGSYRDIFPREVPSFQVDVPSPGWRQ